MSVEGMRFDVKGKVDSSGDLFFTEKDSLVKYSAKVPGTGALRMAVTELKVTSGVWTWDVEILTTSAEYGPAGVSTEALGLDSGSLGTDATEIMIQGGQLKVYELGTSSYKASSATAQIGDIIRTRLDVENHTIEYSLNGTFIDRSETLPGQGPWRFMVWLRDGVSVRIVDCRCENRGRSEK